MPETHAPPARDDAAARIPRRLLGAGLAGLAASLLPQLTRRAAATTPPDDTTGATIPPAGSTPQEGEEEDSTPGTDTVVPEQPTPDETGDTLAPDASVISSQATTTTEAPRRPTEADLPLLRFARAVEMAVIGAYDDVIGAGGLDDTTRTILETIREAHQAYGQAGGALLGTSVGDPIDVDLGITPVSGDQDSLLMALYGVEATALATHTNIIGRLEATEGGRLLASMALIEARNCTVLADLAGETDLDVLLLTDAEPLQMAEG